MHDGKQIKGTLDEVMGAGGNTWHLMVDKYYWGRLRMVNDQWFFDENKPAVGHLVDHFAVVVIAWHG